MEKKVMKNKIAYLPACKHEASAMNEVSRALELISHLQAFLCPLIPAKKGMDQQASNLFQEIMSALLQAISILDSGAAAQVSSSKKMKRVCHGDGSATTVNKSRRANDSRMIVTTEPFSDGYQWKKYGKKDIKNSKFPRKYGQKDIKNSLFPRKYGQKDIKNSMFPRTYYKCINGECQARKIVQQQDKEIDEPPKFTVIYDMQHTCNYHNSNVQEINQLDFFTMGSSSSSTSTSTVNFGPNIIESSSFMMNNINAQQQLEEQTSSTLTSHTLMNYQHDHNFSEDHIDITAANAQMQVDDMAGIFSPLSPLLVNHENIEVAWEHLNLMSLSHESGSFHDDQDGSDPF